MKAEDPLTTGTTGSAGELVKQNELFEAS